MMVLLASILAACAVAPLNSTVSNECDARETRAFYIVNHGLHTGIVVKRADLTALIPELGKDLDTGEFLEVGWGDEKFYQARKVTPALAIQAMLWPTSSVLHVTSIPESPRSYFPKNEILEISVPPSGYAGLLGYIAETFEYTAENQVIRLGPGLYGKGYFYKATGSFHALNTCNTWTAGAIEITGYPIDSEGIIRSESLLNRLRQGITIEMKCYSVR